MRGITKKQLFIILGALIIFIAVISFSFYYFKQQSQPLPSSQPLRNLEGPALTTEGIVKNIDDKSINLEKDNKQQYFNLIDSTIYYKCADYKNINSCAKTKQDLKIGSELKIYSKGTTAVIIMYK